MRTSYLRQQAGYDVVALDVAPGAIEVCRRRGVRQTVTGTVADLRAANVLPFDTLLLLGNNLELQRDEQHAPVMLATLAELTTPGAVIIGQNLNPYANASPLNVAYHQRNRERGRSPGQIRMRVRHENLATA